MARHTRRRLDHSLTFIRDVARLEGGDPLLASQAALELAIARTGARAGVVHSSTIEAVSAPSVSGRIGPAEGQTARCPARSDDQGRLRERSAGTGHRSSHLAELAEAGRDQSDVATPIIDEVGEVLGVLALRGVPPDSLCHALVHDLGLIARWCAKTNAARGLAIDQTTPASGEPDRRPAPPELKTARPPGSQRFN